MKSRFILIILLYVSLVSISAGQQLLDGIVAIIGKEIVLKSEIDQYVQSYAIQNKLNLRQNPELLQKLQKQIMEKMVEQKILLAQAEEDTVKVDDREVDKRVEQNINYMIQQVGSEEKLEESFQSPIKKIKRDLRKETIERMKIEILRRTKFQNIKISRREIEQFYKNYQDSLPQVKETVDISHILKQVKAGTTSRQNALEKIRFIQNQLNNGADFAELAKKYSQDLGTASRGGDLGFTSRGDFVKEFEVTAYSLEPGEISDIVETQFGFHIIKLAERRGEKIRTSHILVQLAPSAEDENLIVMELNNIRTQILGGASFDSMAYIYSDDENSKNDNGHLGIWEVEKLAIPAFRQVVKFLKPGEISEPFKTDFGYHIVKLNKHQQPRALSLEKDWENIEQIALNFKIEREYKKWIDSIKMNVPIDYRIKY